MPELCEVSVGRPSRYSNEIATSICERLANGESLRAITREPEMPAQSSVFKWLIEHKDFSEQYARAREAQADAIADEVLYIADNTEEGVKTTVKANGDVETVTRDMTEHRRLRIDARKWFAGKLAPKKYGNTLKLDHSGSVQHTHTLTGPISFDELRLKSHDEAAAIWAMADTGLLKPGLVDGKQGLVPVREAEFEDVSERAENESGEIEPE